MARSRANGRSRSRLAFWPAFWPQHRRADGGRVLHRPEQHIVWQVLGFLVRARVELTVATVLVTVALVGREQIGPDATFVLMAATTLVVFAVPASRRYVHRRVWCVVTRHRMRSCMVQTRTMTHDGRMPFLLWSRPSPVGERVRVWLPAGMSVKNLEQITQQLATACWAREVRVHGSRSQAAYMLVDIVRRDPLASSTIRPVVIDDLSDDDFDDDTEGTVAPLPDRASLTPASTVAPDPATNGQRQKKPATVPARTNRSPPEEIDDSEDRVTGFGGVDVSDYV